MMTLSLDLRSLADVQAQLRAAAPRQVRFATSLGLNRTADEIQAAIRHSLAQRFTLRRRTWVERTIYRQPREDFARHTSLTAGVRIHPEHDILAKFEAGGVKRPREGRFLAIPVGVRPTPSTVVPRHLRLRALLEGGRAFIRGGRVFRRLGRGRRARVELAYLFRPAVPIPRSLGFRATSERIAARRLVPNVAGAISIELSRGLTTRSAPAEGTA